MEAPNEIGLQDTFMVVSENHGMTGTIHRGDSFVGDRYHMVIARIGPYNFTINTI